MQTDPLADFLTQIRNALRARKAEVRAPYSKMKAAVAEILKKDGYIEDFSLTKENDRPMLAIQLKYGPKHERAILGLRRISTPGRRRYVGARDIPRVLSGLGIAILSTSRGVLSGHEARKQNVGGELLAYVW